MGVLIGLVVIGAVIRALAGGRGGRYLVNRTAHKTLSKAMRRL